MALGKSGIHLSAIASTSNDQVGIKVYIYSTLADAALPQLEAQRDAIEAEVGEKLEWNPNPENRDKVIVLYRKASLRERDSWPGHLDWLMEMTRRFRKAFVPRIKKLDLTQPSPSEEDE